MRMLLKSPRGRVRHDSNGAPWMPGRWAVRRPSTWKGGAEQLNLRPGGFQIKYLGLDPRSPVAVGMPEGNVS